MLVGEGRTLLLRNVRIVHAASLAACLQLSAGAPCRSQLLSMCDAYFANNDTSGPPVAENRQVFLADQEACSWCLAGHQCALH